MDSLEPVIELLQRQCAHEDFSARASWIKEDFERSFYSKRAKLKVEFVETLDHAPVWSVDECEEYGEILFRDLIAALNVRERRLLPALRSGKTVRDLAMREGSAVTRQSHDEYRASRPKSRGYRSESAARRSSNSAGRRRLAAQLRD
jgi:hypothetical protein